MLLLDPLCVALDGVDGLLRTAELQREKQISEVSSGKGQVGLVTAWI